MTPINPIITALHLVALTFSLKKNILNNVTKMGPANVIATVSANYKFLSAMKIAAIAKAPKALRQKCKLILFVL